MKNLVLACVVAVALCPIAVAGDIAISTQAGWFSQEAADREMQEIVDNVTAVAVEQFAADNQAALADWVVAHTGDGVPDLLILCGQLPDTIYPAGNTQPDGSIAELFLDDGNIIVNTGDWIFYVVNSAGSNGPGGLQNMMDIPGVTVAGEDNTAVTPTAEGSALTPSLGDLQTDRPFHLDTLEGAWFAELVLAQNAAGTRADPVIVANAETGGRIGIFYQTASQDNDPRGEVISEWINNWFVTAGEVVNPGFPALNPSPANGAVDVLMPLFEWEAGWGAELHEVYFGDSPDTLALMMATPALMYFHALPLVPGQTYYWRVDEVDAAGAKTTGNLWSFTVMPLEAHFPSPPDGAMFRQLNTQLSWAAGQGAVTHDVYFGTDPDALDAVSPGQAETTFAPEGLVPLTTYYWKVDEPGAPGPVWSFSTVDPNGGVVAQYWDNQYFEGEPAVVTTEAEVNFDFNAQRNSSPHPDIPIDHFSCRWTGELQVPVTGTYTLYEASDDGARMFLNGVQVAAGWWDRGTTEDTTGPLELVAGERYLLVMEMYENGGGAAAYLRWEGPGIPKQIIPQGALQIPQMAISPAPAI
ncbi:MAG: hypothetical protein JW741_10300, partial [Sedimentisphaerales bacterium]|nr:hypothetical protein [Sedimentisphaerales bacterium]